MFLFLLSTFAAVKFSKFPHCSINYGSSYHILKELFNFFQSDSQGVSPWDEVCFIQYFSGVKL